MNNEITEDTKQDNLWVVQGTNWICYVVLDEYNSRFSSIRQAEESATQAIEQFQGQDRGLTFEIAAGEKVPLLGGIVLVYPFGTDSNDGFLLFVHELLANAGYYKESFKVEKQTQEVLDKNLESLKIPIPEDSKTDEKPKDNKKIKKTPKKSAPKTSKKKTPKKPKKDT